VNLDMHYLLSLIEKTPPLPQVLKHLKLHCESDPAHDLQHSLRVAAWTTSILGETVEPRLSITAALLHDVVNLPKNSPNRVKASALAAKFANDKLPELGFSAQEVSVIADAIRDHSYSLGRTPSSPLGRALQDADRLEALGAIGLMRTFAVGAAIGAEFFHPDDPWATNRKLNDRAFSIDHFFTKLLKLPDSMQTSAGRLEATRRVEFMRNFLIQLGHELHWPLPHPMTTDVDAPE